MADERAHPIDDERAERQRHHDEEVARLQEVAARTARERDQVQREHDQLRGEHDQLRGEYDRLQRAHDRLKRQHKRLQQQLAAARRAGFRQAAPFAKDRPQGRGGQPGRRAPAAGIRGAGHGAYYVLWHMLEAWRPLLFGDEAHHAKATRDAVAPATRSEAALRKVHSKTLDDGSEVHSFHTLLTLLSSIVRNVCRVPGAPPDVPTFDVVTTPSAKQQRAYRLLESIKL